MRVGRRGKEAPSGREGVKRDAKCYEKAGKRGQRHEGGRGSQGQGGEMTEGGEGRKREAIV